MKNTSQIKFALIALAFSLFSISLPNASSAQQAAMTSPPAAAKPAMEDSLKALADTQLQLHILKEQQALEAIKAKAEEDKRRAEEARLAAENARTASLNPNPGVPLSPMPGFPSAGQSPLNPGEEMPQFSSRDIELVSVYGSDEKSLLADILFKNKLITMSVSNDRGVRWINGWRVREINTRVVTLQQITSKDKDGDATGRTFKLALKNAPLAPVVGDAQQAPIRPSGPVAQDDNTLVRNRLQQELSNRANNVNQAGPGVPVPNAILQPR